MFVSKDFPSNLLAIEERAIESFCIELNLSHSKWPINCSYIPHKNDRHPSRQIKQTLDKLFANCEKIQKKPSRCVLRKRYSENMQQNYRKTPMLKCDFNKVV